MKVGIVGGNICGSYLAWRLAGEHDVTVFERGASSGNKACSGLISDRLWSFMPENRELVEHLVFYANIHFPKRTVTVKFSPKMLVVERSWLDKYAANLAKKEGVNVLYNHEVTGVATGGKPVVHANGQDFEFDYVIGCDGALSAVRKSLNVADPHFRLGIYAYKKERSDSDAVDTFPLRNGFKWKIPRRKYVEYGVLESAERAREEFSYFMEQVRFADHEAKAAIIPEGLRLSSSKSVALCGDAAGLTKHWSGGGIIWGLTAADMLVKSGLRTGKYNAALKRFFLPNIYAARIKTFLANFGGSRGLSPKKVVFDPDWG